MVVHMPCLRLSIDLLYPVLKTNLSYVKQTAVEIISYLPLSFFLLLSLINART